jgi:sugar lactone lactonase YvrE
LLTTAPGSLFCFQENKAPDEALKELTIPNSVGWSPDAKTMYFTHSTAQQVLAFDYSPSGNLYNQRVFYQHEGPGDPDGFKVDADGNLWHAVYGEFRVLKISPQGRLVGEVRLPTRNITCVEFIGTELFITTAGDPDAEGGEESRELGGALFRVEVGVTGLPPYKFKLGSA